MSLPVIEYSCTILNWQSITCQRRTSCLAHPTAPLRPPVSLQESTHGRAANYPAISPFFSLSLPKLGNIHILLPPFPSAPIPLFATNFSQSQECEYLHRKPLPRAPIVLPLAPRSTPTPPSPASHDATSRRHKPRQCLRVPSSARSLLSGRAPLVSLFFFSILVRIFCRWPRSGCRRAVSFNERARPAPAGERGQLSRASAARHPQGATSY